MDTIADRDIGGANAPQTPPAQIMDSDPFREPPGAPKSSGGMRRKDVLIPCLPWPEELLLATPTKRMKLIDPHGAGDSFGPRLSNKKLPSWRRRDRVTRQMNLNTYKYSPLDFTGAQIRLLVLYAGSFEDDIFCRLEHCTLDNQITFDALSYTWGDLTDSRHIRISGKYHPVTKNLESALRHLRSESSNRLLWIDALCINQKDIRERNHQVQEMKRIYGSARRVLAWTGESQVGSDNVMLKIGTVFTKDVDISHFNKMALYALTSRSYWSRIWVAQEIAVAKRTPLVIAGRMSAPCSAFNILFSAFRVGLPQMASFLSLRDRFRNEKEIDLASLFFLTAHTHATDPRDMVYALLGLARDVDRNAIVPDYTKSFEHVCKEVVRHLVLHDSKLKILSRIVHTPSTTFPSWVPDFSVEMAIGELWQSDHHAQYAASSTTTAAAQFSDDLSTLRLEGSCVDTILDVFGPFKNGRDIVKLLPDVIKEAAQFLLKEDEGRVNLMRGWMYDVEEHKMTGSTAIPSVICDALVKAVSEQIFEPLRNLGAQRDFRPDLFDFAKPTKQLDLFHSDYIDFTKPTKQPERYDPFHTNSAFYRSKLIKSEFYSRTSPEGIGEYGNDIRATQPLVETLASRSLFITRTGLIGIGPKYATPGDLVCLLYGGDVFYILRQYFGQHQFIGDAYVHKVMNGELLYSRPTQEFILR